MPNTLNQIRAYLHRKGPSGINAIARAIRKDVADVSGYMTNDMLNNRIVVNRGKRPYTYELCSDFGDCLLVSDAIDLIEAIGGTVTFDPP